MQSTRQKPKARAMALILKNPEFARTLKEAWDSPFGSSKRVRAKSVMNIVKKTIPNFEEEMLDAAPPAAYNPWESLPAHKPVLNYAPIAPKRGKKMDGQGGDVYGPPSEYALDSTNRWSPPALDWGSSTPIASSLPTLKPEYQPTGEDRLRWKREAEERSQNEMKNAFVGGDQTVTTNSGSLHVPGIRASSPLSSQSGSFDDPARFSGLSGSVIPMDIGTGRSIDDIMAEIEEKKEKSIGRDSAFSISRPESSSFTTQNFSVPGFSQFLQQPEIGKQATGDGKLVVPEREGRKTLMEAGQDIIKKANEARDSKQILKGEGDKLYAWDGKIARPIADQATLSILVNKQGFKDTRIPLSTFVTQSIPQVPTSSVTQTPAPQFSTKPEDLTKATNKIAAIPGINVEDVVKLKTSVEEAFKKGLSWGEVFDEARQMLPESISNEDIDNFLDLKWKNPGAYESFSLSMKGPAGDTSTPSGTYESPGTGSTIGTYDGGAYDGNVYDGGTYSGGSTSDPFALAGGDSGDQNYSPGTYSSGAYRGIGMIPGLDPNLPENRGLSMTEYESKALNALANVSDEVWNQNFPGMPKPYGADLVGHVQALIDIKKEELGLVEKQAQLSKMLEENPTFALDVRDYIVGQDQHLNKIDALLTDAKDQLANNSDFPLLRKMNEDYVNHLVGMKTKTVQRYGGYLNKAVDVRNAAVTALQNDIQIAQNELASATTMIGAQAEQDFARIKAIIDENWQKPALAAQAEAQRVKDERESIEFDLKILKAKDELETPKTEDWLKMKDAAYKQMKDPVTGGVNAAAADITEAINLYAPSNPTAVYEALEMLMVPSINDPVKNSDGEWTTGLYNKERMIETYEQSIGSHYADLQNQFAQVDQVYQTTSDPTERQQASDYLGMLTGQMAELRKVQESLTAVIGQKMGEDFTKLDDGDLTDIRNFFVKKDAKWYLPESKEALIPADFSDAKKQEFIANFGSEEKLTSGVATWLFEAIKRQVTEAAKARGSDTLDARFYFDSQEGLEGTEIGQATKMKMATDTLNYILANFGITQMMA